MKFIIENKTDINDFNLMSKVLAVIEYGLVSNKDSEYCYHTQFTDGIHISFKKTIYGYKIVAWRDKNE